MDKNNRPIIEKKHRLKTEIYTGKKIVAFTGNVKDRKNLFSDIKVFNEIEKILLGELKKHQCEAFIYLFMPDHFHFLIEGKNHKSNIKKCMDSFKQSSGYWLYKNLYEYKWQKDYYDHILRSNEDLTNHVHYILNNPVRTCLVNYWKDYKMFGSTVFDLKNWE